MLKFLTILIGCVVWTASTSAQQEFHTTQSFSKQFVVNGPREAPRNVRPGKIPLTPTYLTVSCERIKQAILSTFADGFASGRSTRSEAKIYVVLHPGTEERPTITPIRTSSALSYRLDIPNQIRAAELIEVLTETVLFEIANRRTVDQAVEVPRWLIRGVAEEVKANSPQTLLFQQNMSISNTKLQTNSIAQIRKNLIRYSPLTFAELSHPENLSSQRSTYFGECSRLFFHEILRLNHGGANLRQMLDNLPGATNGEAAFLGSFREHFANSVEVEKWWSLRLAGLSGRDASQLLSQDQSMELVDGALRISMQKSDSPRQPWALQEIISQMESSQQNVVLRKILTQLRAMRLRVQPEFVGLIDGYCVTLDHHLQNNEKPGFLKRVFFRQNRGDLPSATNAKLTALDQQRARLRNRPKPQTREQAILSAMQFSAPAKPATSPSGK